jgi:hypothetical protein
LDKGAWDRPASQRTYQLAESVSGTVQLRGSPTFCHRAKVEGQSRNIQEQEATIMQPEKGIKTVVACLEEQPAQIQKVSATT